MFDFLKYAKRDEDCDEEDECSEECVQRRA